MSSPEDRSTPVPQIVGLLCDQTGPLVQVIAECNSVMYEHLDKDREMWNSAFRRALKAEEKLVKLLTECTDEQQVRYVVQDLFTVTRYAARHDSARKLGGV